MSNVRRPINLRVLDKKLFCLNNDSFLRKMLNIIIIPDIERIILYNLPEILGTAVRSMNMFSVKNITIHSNNVYDLSRNTSKLVKYFRTKVPDKKYMKYKRFAVPIVPITPSETFSLNNICVTPLKYRNVPINRYIV